MKIPNYDVKDDFSSNYKQKVSFMPDRCFRMLICAFYHLIFEFPSQNEQNMICRELGISKSKYQKATQDPYSFLYLDKPRKFISKNFDEHII